MPSPFPGMNPYFEQPGSWRGIHSTFLVHLQAQIAPRVQPKYFTKIEETLYVDRAREERRRPFAIADIGIAKNSDTARSGTALAVARPVQARLPKVTKRPGKRLSIFNRANRRLVTVIEVLSPSNKDPKRDRRQYLLKREELLSSDVNLVEIDLLRGGRKMPLQNAPPDTYSIVVSRASDRPDVDLWSFTLREPIPRFPLPLADGDPEPMLDLKQVVDQAYDSAVLELGLYEEEPQPPLSPADLKWAKGILRNAGVPAK